MKKEVALAQLDESFRSLADKFLAAVEAAGVPILVTAARRTIKEQNALFAQGRTAPGRIVTRAKGGQSPHNFGCAIDIVPLRDGKPDWNAPQKIWERLGAIGIASGLVWGGNFHSIMDKPHFETHDWKNLQAEWRAGRLEVI